MVVAADAFTNVLSIYLFIYFSIHSFIYVFVYLFTYFLFIYSFIYLFIGDSFQTVASLELIKTLISRRPVGQVRDDEGPSNC